MNYQMPHPERLCVMDRTDNRDGTWTFRCVKCHAERTTPMRYNKDGTPQLNRDPPSYRRECDKWYKGLGSRLHWILKMAGITPERWSRWTKRPCKCKEKQEMYDRLVPWL